MTVAGQLPSQPPLRAAQPRDAEALLDLERRTNTVAFARIFDPAAHPFPEGDVLLRWQRLLDDPDVVIMVVPTSDRLRGVVCVQLRQGRVEHLIVEPAAWGSGLAAGLMSAGVERLAAAGVRRAELTCLVENHRARAFYAKHGWSETGPDGRAPWPPYPQQIALTRGLAACRARGTHDPIGETTAAATAAPQAERPRAARPGTEEIT